MSEVQQALPDFSEVKERMESLRRFFDRFVDTHAQKQETMLAWGQYGLLIFIDDQAKRLLLERHLPDKSVLIARLTLHAPDEALEIEVADPLEDSDECQFAGYYSKEMTPEHPGADDLHESLPLLEKMRHLLQTPRGVEKISENERERIRRVLATALAFTQK